MIISELTCEICKKEVKSSYGYKEHMITHITSADIYPCTTCTNVYSLRNDLLDHLKITHGLTNKKIEEINKWKPFCDTISIRIFAYINDLHTYFKIFNPLLAVFCFSCLRFPKYMRHKCVNHKLDLTSCPMCKKHIGNSIQDFVEHLLEKCERNKATFRYSPFK